MIKKFKAILKNPKKLPFFISKVRAGFPSPAGDHVEKKMSLDERLIKRKSSSFYLQATGDSMIDVGITDNAILLIDRSLEARNGDIVVVSINGDHTLKRYKKVGDKVFLYPANPKYKPIELKEGSDNILFGVVKAATNIYRDD